MKVDWGSVRTRDGVKPDAAVLDVFVTSEDIDTVYDAYWIVLGFVEGWLYGGGWGGGVVVIVAVFDGGG